MRTKALFLYIALGAAFAAVSLWVFFSRGKSAKAIRAKYRLGGAMIAAWTLLSASGHTPPPPPEVTCYEPPAPSNEVNILPKHGSGCQLHVGDTLIVRVYDPTYEKFRVNVFSAEEDPKLIQSSLFELESKNLSVANFDLTIEETSFKGDALVEISGVKEEDEEETDNFVGSRSISIL